VTTNRKPKLLAICGSLRRASTNRKLLAGAVAGARQAGAEVTELDMLDFPMAAYNEDDQNKNGLPESALKLRKLVHDSDGILFAVPEYNNALPGGFKNQLDWISRRDKEGPLSEYCFKGRFAALMGASGSTGGAKRCLAEMRHILHTFGMHVIPEQVSLQNARTAFDDSGALKDDKTAKSVFALGARLSEVITKLAF
jgi:NAD(P)H-dependent FMN reductase